MNTLNKIMIVVLTTVVGLSLLFVINEQTDSLSGEEVSYSIDQNLDIYYDNFEVVSNTAYTIGKVNSIEFSSDDQFMIVGGETATSRLRVLKLIDGVYTNVEQTISNITSEVRSVDITETGNKVAVGLGGGLDRINVYSMDSDGVLTLDDAGLPSNIDDTINAVEFIGNVGQFIAFGGYQTLGDLRIYQFNYVDSEYDFNFIDDDGGIINDIDSTDDLLAVGHTVGTHINFYRWALDGEGATVFTEFAPSISVSKIPYDLDFSDNGEYLSVAYSDGSGDIFRINDDDTITRMNVDTAISGFGYFLTTEFVDSNIVYFGGDNGALKYKYDSINDEFDRLDSDLTTYNTMIRMIDFNNSYDKLVVGDNVGYIVYNFDRDIVADSFNLPVEPYNVVSIYQDGLQKDFTLEGSTITINDPSDDSLATINYTLFESSGSGGIYVLFPIIAVVVIISGMVVYIKFK